jgi:hypothetical protein
MALRRVLIAAFVVVAGATPLSAQTLGLPPVVGGLFGSGNPTGSQNLAFTMFLTEAYDSDVYADFLRGRVDATETKVAAYSTMFSGTAAYRGRFGRSATVRGTANSILQYFPDFGGVRSTSHRGALGLFTDVPGAGSLLLNQSVNYIPSDFSNLFHREEVSEPGEAGPPPADYNSILNGRESYFYDTSLRLTRALTRRTRLSVQGEFEYTDFVHESINRHDNRAYWARGTFMWDFKRRTSATFGYKYRVSDLSNPVGFTAEQHVVDFGLRHSRPRPRGRQAVYAASVGVSSSEVPTEETDGTIVISPVYRVHAELRMHFPLGRSWEADTSYRRGMEYVPGLTEPVFNDSARGGVNWFPARRMTISAGGAYTSGASQRRNLLFDTYTGRVRVAYVVMGGFSVYSEYLSYYYNFGRSTAFAEPLTNLRRDGVRAGLVLQVPVLGR